MVSASDTDRTVNRLSVVASLGLVGMVVATAMYIGWPRVAGAIGMKPAPPAPAYSAGQKIDVPAEWYSGSPKTLLIFARATCGACQKAQPFIKGLVGRLNGRAAAVMAHPAGDPDDLKYAESIGVTESNIVVVRPGLRVRSTPTIVLLNENGTVLDAWEGAGPPEKQASIVKAIDAALR